MSPSLTPNLSLNNSEEANQSIEAAGVSEEECHRSTLEEVPGLKETIGKETELLCLRGHSPDKQWLGVVSGIAVKQNSEAEEHREQHRSPHEDRALLLQTPSPVLSSNTLTSTQTYTNYLVSLRPLKNQVGKSNQHNYLFSVR